MAFERWLPAVGYEGLYEISDFGRVRRIEGAFYWRPSAKILAPQFSHDGYCKVFLSKTGNAGKKQWEFMHCLVAAAFIGPKPPGHDVDHLDGNRANNQIENLRYLYHKENKRKKLSHQDVAEIRRLCLEGFNQYELAQMFGVRQSHISRIANFVRRKYQPRIEKD
jgi:hypothetical protein